MKFQQLAHCVEACVESAESARRPAIRDAGLSLWHVLEGLACGTFLTATFWLVWAMAASR